MGMYPSFLRVAQNEGGWIGSGFEPTEKATTTDGIWGELVFGQSDRMWRCKSNAVRMPSNEKNRREILFQLVTSILMQN